MTPSAKAKASVPAKPRTAHATVRGFVNMAPPVPASDVVVQKELGVAPVSGGRGLLYGPGNTMPSLALEAALNSGTAYRCLERRTAFLEGTGFPVDPAKPGAGGDAPVPGQPGKTINDLWSEVCSDGAYHNGAAFLVRYANDYTLGEVYALPHGAVRKTDKGTFLFNTLFGRKGFKSSSTTEHQPFNNSEDEVKRIVDWANTPVDEKDPDGPTHGQPGQILYLYIPKAGEKDYPLPPHWAGIEDVWADAAYAKFDLDEVENGFNSKGILAMVGEDDTQTEGADGLTDREETDQELKLFTQAGAQAQGQRRRTVMVLDVKTKDAVPVWIPMNTSVNMQWLDGKREAIGQTVCRHIGIPPILAGFAKAGQLGAAQEILNAVELTQDDLMPLRRCLERGTKRLFPVLTQLTVGNKKPISFIPPEIYAQLTPDEIRKLADYGPKPAQPTSQP